MLPAILDFMTKGGYRKAGAGFTVVETMIVLVVTSALFISAAILVSGRQNRTQFTTAINNLQQQLQQLVNETANNYYPNKGNVITCTPSGVGGPTLTAGATAQGSNYGCIFLGKAVQFGIAGNLNALGVIPVVGNQNSGGTASLTIAAARPRLVYTATTEAPGSVPDLSTIIPLENGLSVATSNTAGACPAGGMCYTTTGGVKRAAGMIAFIAGDNAGNIASVDSNSNLNSNSQQMSLYGVNTSAANETLADASKAAGYYAGSVTSGLETASSASICIASATTNQSGLYSFDSGLNVTLQIKNGKTC